MTKTIESIALAIVELEKEFEQSTVEGRKILETYQKANPVESIEVESEIQKRISITYNIGKAIQKLRKQIIRLERIQKYY